MNEHALATICHFGDRIGALREINPSLEKITEKTILDTAETSMPKQMLLATLAIYTRYIRPLEEKFQIEPAWPTIETALLREFLSAETIFVKENVIVGIETHSNFCIVGYVAKDRECIFKQNETALREIAKTLVNIEDSLTDGLFP